MKSLRYIFLLASVLLIASCHSSQEARNKVLKVYNWADYIDEDVLAEFPQWYKEQTGEEIEVIYQVFDINEVMLTKIERGHEDFDVVCPSDYIIERMMRKDMLVPIDRNFGTTPDYIPNVAPYMLQLLDNVNADGRKGSDYAVAYMWGTAGILYNTDLVTEEEALTWGTLWDPKNKGKVLMKDAYRDCYGTAIIYANTDRLASGETSVKELMNDNSKEAIDLVESTMKALKPNIAGWEADFGKEMMTKGKASLNFTWSGDAVWAIEEAGAVGVELNYVVPVEGSNVWFDGWVIPKYARNVKAASYFINYLCRPDIAMRNMDAIGYVSAIATSEILEYQIDTTLTNYSDLSYFFGPGCDSVQVCPIQYPDAKVIERCAVIRDFSNKKDLERVLEMWSRVKGDNLNTGIVLLIFAVFGALFVWLVISKVKKIRRNMKRRHRGVKRRSESRKK